MDKWMAKVCDAIWEVTKKCDKKCENCRFKSCCIMDKTVGELVKGKKELEPMIDQILKPEPETCCGLEQLELFK